MFARLLLGRTRPLCRAALTSAGKYAAGAGRRRGVLGTGPFPPLPARPRGRVGRARGWGMWSRGRSSPKSPKMSSRVWVCGAELLVPAGGCCGRVSARLGLMASPFVSAVGKGSTGGECRGAQRIPSLLSTSFPRWHLSGGRAGALWLQHQASPQPTPTPPCPALCQRWHGRGALFSLY